jgi:hypothetical protein
MQQMLKVLASTVNIQKVESNVKVNEKAQNVCTISYITMEKSYAHYGERMMFCCLSGALQI